MKELHIQVYLAEVQQKIAENFEDVVVEHVPHSLNAHTDPLARLAGATTTSIDHPITIEVILMPRPIVEILKILEDNRMKPIQYFLTIGQIPDGVKDQRGFGLKSVHYTILDGFLCKGGFIIPLLRCVDPRIAKEMLEEFHESTGGMHEGPHVLASWILHYSYY